MIRRGGLQIDVLEMERLLSEHAKIAEVVVVGIAHPRLGEQAVIVAIPKVDSDRPRLEDLVAHLIERGLPRECLPEQVVFTGDVATHGVGQIQPCRVAQVAGRTNSR